MIISNLDKDIQNKLYKHLDLVIEKNKILNLTRISDKEKGAILHIEDSLSCLEEFNRKTGVFLDIGTGGGYPGLPLAIVSGRKGVLIDSVKKKANAVQEIVNKLDLTDQVEVIGIRSEELALDRPEYFDTVVARAVSSIPSLLELASPLLKKGGDLILLKTKDDEEDFNRIENIASRLGYSLSSVRSLNLNNEFNRRIIVFSKTHESEIKLPRRNGLAQNKPIS